MPRVDRSEILDFVTYTERRPQLRPAILEQKRIRRIVLGPITLLVENHDTVYYQVQEMMRVEHIVREKDIAHELHTYNELLGKPGELGASLLIALTEDVRDAKLRAWLGLLPTLYFELPDGSRVPPTWDARQVGDDRLSSVQYLKFDLGGVTPVAFGCSFEDPDIQGRVALTEEQRMALQADLAR